MTSRSGACTAFVTGLLAVGLLVVGAAPVAAQSSWLTGYVLTVPLVSGSTALSDSNASNFNRFRLSTEQAVGPLFFEAAYEHAVTFQQNVTPLSLGLGGLVDIQSGGEWFDLQGTISRHDQEHMLWRHRFDRLNVAWAPTEAMELSVGRQAISWGTTQVFTPADPFPAFSPTDPFQVFRAGVDAARLRIYPSALSEIDIVFRPSRTDVGEEVTALARGFATWKNWGLSAWGGTLYGDPAGAVGASGGIGPWAVNFEAVVRDYHGTVVGRGAIGTFRLFQGRRSGSHCRGGVPARRAWCWGTRRAAHRAAVPRVPPRRVPGVRTGRGGHHRGVPDPPPLEHHRHRDLEPQRSQRPRLSRLLLLREQRGVSRRRCVHRCRCPAISCRDSPCRPSYGLAGVTGYLSLTWYF